MLGYDHRKGENIDWSSMKNEAVKRAVYMEYHFFGLLYHLALFHFGIWHFITWSFGYFAWQFGGDLFRKYTALISDEKRF